MFLENGLGMEQVEKQTMTITIYWLNLISSSELAVSQNRLQRLPFFS
jgi:hypothetical protein